MTDNVAVLIDDVSVLVHGTSNQLLGITFNELTNLVLIFVLDEAVFYNDETLEAGKGGLFVVWRDGQCLSATDNVTLSVPELTFRVGLDAQLGKLFGIALDKLTSRCAFAVDDLAVLVALAAFEDR